MESSSSCSVNFVPELLWFVQQQLSSYHLTGYAAWCWGFQHTKMAFANGDGETRFFFSFFNFFFFCSLAEEARRCVDLHVHRVYIEDTYVRSISMYEVSVCTKYQYYCCCTTINSTYHELWAVRSMWVGCAWPLSKIHVRFFCGERWESCTYTCDMESSSSCTVNVVAELLWFVQQQLSSYLFPF